MHELSIAEDMLRIIGNVLGARRELSTVTLVLGPLSGVSAESLQFCFCQIAEMRGFGSPELVIRDVPAVVHCRSCNNNYEAKEFYEGCPFCGSFEREILSGRECMVESVEIEEDDTG